MEKKEKMIEELKKKYECNQDKFQMINVSNDGSFCEKKTFREVEEEFNKRQSLFEEHKKRKQDINTYQEHTKFTFTPQINENSK